ASTRGFGPVRIEVGGKREEPTILTRQDWRGPRSGWGPNDLGVWELEIARDGVYELAARVLPRRFPTVARAAIRGVSRQIELQPGADAFAFHDLNLTAGPGRLEVWVEGNGATAGVLGVTVGRRGTWQ